MNKYKKTVTILSMGILLSMTYSASGVIVRFSLDGENPAPDTLDVVPGEIFTMYVVSYSPGESYLKEMDAPVLLTVEDDWIYPEAGDLASVLTLSPWTFEVSADDSMGEILAGKHFAFEVMVALDTVVGERDYFYLWSGPDPDDAIRITVVPEPGTMMMLGLGALGLWRRRKKRCRCG